MRVISGSAGGLRLLVPKSELRPSMDKVRAAIFSSLGDFVQDSLVLDLFAGSGAYGIEALSRGAAKSVFVDIDAASENVIEKNLQMTHLKDVGRFIKQDVHTFLKHSPITQEKYDLIIADPPYKKQKDDRDHITELLTNVEWQKWLQPHGILILEMGKNLDFHPYPTWEIVRDRNYGKSRVIFLRQNH